MLRPILRPSSHRAVGATNANRRQRLLVAIMYGFLALMTVAVIGIEGWSRAKAWQGDLESSREATENIAQASAEQAEGALNTVLGMLDGLVERVETDGTTGAAGVRLQRFMLTRLDKHKSLQGLFVYDRDGRGIVGTRADATPANRSDRAYFIYHRTHPGTAIYLGAPIVSRSSGEWVITMSRRVDDASGGFAGVVLATIPVYYFQRYYERFRIGARGVVLFAFTDGTRITRLPSGPDVAGGNIRQTPIYQYIQGRQDEAGTVMLTTRFDGVERQYSYRRVPSFPLLVAAALAKDEILADWWKETVRGCAIVLVLLGLIYAVGFWLIAQFRVQSRLEATLRQTQAELEARNAELDRQARTDALTGLRNRRCFDEMLAKETARTARERVNLALIMIDVDFFKRYNDEYGHAGGDDCLRMIGAVLAETIMRPGDIAARIGGEEFAVLLPGTEPEGALHVAERLRQAVAGRRVAHRGNPEGIVTISAGVAALAPGHMADPAAADRALIEAADAALYAAKLAGRNCVRCAPASSPPPPGLGN